MTDIRLQINGQDCFGQEGQTILDVAKKYGITILALCCDKRTDPEKYCSVCVVEVKGEPELVRACVTPVREGMVVTTDTIEARRFRKKAMEAAIEMRLQSESCIKCGRCETVRHLLDISVN